MVGSVKKPVLIGIIVLCLAVAAAVTYKSRSRDQGGIESIPADEMMWVKCNNPQCKAEYQIPKREYFQFIEKNVDPMATRPPGMRCKECGKDSVYRAVKCPKCGTVFFYGVAGPSDFADRCPNCKFSETEDSRKRARSSSGTK